MIKLKKVKYSESAQFHKDDSGGMIVHNVPEILGKIILLATTKEATSQSTNIPCLHMT